MGTHPIFESDFDCLTDSQMSEDHDYDENGADMDVEYHQKKKKSKKDKKKKKVKKEEHSDDDAYKKEYDDEDMKEEYASDSGKFCLLEMNQGSAGWRSAVSLAVR